MVEYCNQFLGKIETIKPYLGKFEEDSFIKSKIYLENSAAKGLNWRLMIFIIYNKSIFNAING